MYSANGPQRGPDANSAAQNQSHSISDGARLRHENQSANSAGMSNRFILSAVVLSLSVAGGVCLAQEDDPDATPMDQVVPVADPVEEAPDAVAEQELSDDEQLLVEFGRYKELMDQEVYDEADTAAKRVVELAIRLKGPASMDTARALTNLGIVQHRNGDFEAAQQNFESAVDIIEEEKDRLDEALVNPLKGLGAAQLEAGLPGKAAATFQRAVHLTHVNEGPHNIDQVEILESLAETNLRLGALDQAKQVNDQIYAINVKHYNDSSESMIPALMRRAAWQHRAGFINDERATYRRVIRIIESTAGKEDLSLIEPLTKLGHSFFFVDVSGSEGYGQQSVATGEIYFRRALRIAEEHPEADWKMIAQSRIALGDYYMYEGNHARARKIYATAWQWLSEDDDRLEFREQALGQPVPLRQGVLPRYAGSTERSDAGATDDDLRRGTITVTYSISARGRVSDLKVVEADPPEFEEIQRGVQRELRRRLYRPRFEDAQAVSSPNNFLSHTFFYRQSELDTIRSPSDTAEDTEES